MILVDQREPEEFDYYLSQSCDIRRDNYNQSPGQLDIYPDFTVQAGGKSIGVNRKQSSEFLSGIDAWKDQIRRELASPNIDSLYSIIEGAMSQDGNGVWGWSFQDPSIHLYKSGNGGTATVPGFHSLFPYKHIMGTFIRTHESGVPILFTDSIKGTAIFLAELHSIAEREDWESDIFKKLIKVKYQISELEMIRRNFALFLMGIPGVGEEVAMTLVDGFANFSELFYFMTQGTISEIRLAGGRRIGPAVEKKIREFLGM